MSVFMQACIIVGSIGFAIAGVCFAIRAVIFISIALSPFEKCDK